MKAFTQLMTPQEARAAFARAYAPRPVGMEHVPVLEAFGRVLAEEILAGTDLPAFDRSTVDGYAVRAADAARASKGAPVPLAVVGEVLMGQVSAVAVASGQAARIPTGGALPAGVDAVVMQEVTVRKDGTVFVERRVAPGENIVRRGDDLRAGEVVLRPGRRLRPPDIGLIAGLGHPEVGVFLRPRVAVIVTGDELVAAHAQQRPAFRFVHGRRLDDDQSRLAFRKAHVAINNILIDEALFTRQARDHRRDEDSVGEGEAVEGQRCEEQTNHLSSIFVFLRVTLWKKKSPPRIPHGHVPRLNLIQAPHFAGEAHRRRIKVFVEIAAR